MFQKIKLLCTYKDGDKVTYNWGSLFHGVLMEVLPAEVAIALHDNNQVRPFSQYVLPQAGQKLEWHLGLWGQEMSDTIAQAIMLLNRIEIKHKNISLEVVGVERKKESERDYFARFLDEPCRRYELEFLTPCTHRSSGEYVLFPTPALIFQSLYLRVTPFLNEFSLDDPEALEQLVSHVRIVRYNLRSASFNINGMAIPCYKGQVVLSIRGPEELVRLAGLLLSFAEYAGVGIKTSLGMGGCKITKMQKVGT